MQLHSLKKPKSQRIKKRVGRGGKRGKTSGRGHKGQNARAGTSGRSEMRDLIKKLPKRRGYGKNRARTVNSARLVYTPINLAALETAFSSGDTVSFDTLLEKGLVSKRGGKKVPVKILANGDITKKLTITGLKISATAREKIEKAGGVVAEA